MNLNVSANDINTFKSLKYNGQVFFKFSRCQIFGPIEKYYFQSESVDFFILCSVPNKVHEKVT